MADGWRYFVQIVQGVGKCIGKRLKRRDGAVRSSERVI